MWLACKDKQFKVFSEDWANGAMLRLTALCRHAAQSRLKTKEFIPEDAQTKEQLLLNGVQPLALGGNRILAMSSHDKRFPSKAKV